MTISNINPNDKHLLAEKSDKTYKVSLSTLRCGQSLLATYTSGEMVKIVSFNNDIPFAVNRVNNLYELRSEYRGRSFHRQAARMTFSNDSYRLEILEAPLESKANCYLLLDRRELRIRNRAYHRLSSDELYRIGGRLMEQFVQRFNVFGSSKGVMCDIKDGQNKPLQTLGPYAALTAAELEEFLLDTVTLELADADPLLTAISNDEKVKAELF